MSKEQPTSEEQLFFQLVSSYATGAWIGLGKMKNPVTDKMERNLKQATFSIDMLEMLHQRFGATLAEWENDYLSRAVSELKSIYISESAKDNTTTAEADDAGNA
ncbi:MAG: DUF1844 domain-containing protein [Candidatus Neomarinimicrobiota bacterium]